ncbi:MAG TPA: hypothetical protein VF006_13905 [Longimicrobium sp.]
MVLLATASCGERTASARQGEETDAAVAQWSLARAPELRIGGNDTDGGLHRVMDAVRLHDGTVAVANAGAHQIRVVAPDGRTLRDVGQEGHGPGEFQFPGWVGVRGDTLVVADMLASRVSRFTREGTHLESARFSEAAGLFPQVVGQYRDGTLLVAADEAVDSRKPGVVRGRTALLRLRPDGSLLDTLTLVPSSEQFATVSADGRRFKVESLPFGRRTVMALRNDVLVVGTGETPAVRTIDAEGRTRDLLQVTATPRPVRAADIDAYWKNLVTAGGGPEGNDLTPPQGIPYPAALPPYSDLHLDEAGRVWVAESRLPGEWSQPATWQIFSPNGQPLAQIRLPPRSLLMDAGNDWVLLRELDADQREIVSLYRYSVRR